MANFAIILVMVLLLGSALAYIRKSKKRGVVCVGCPHAGQCGGKCGCGNADTFQ